MAGLGVKDQASETKIRRLETVLKIINCKGISNSINRNVIPNIRCLITDSKFVS